MIVSREHRYVFVQLPQTGCTALGQWMVDHAGGAHILDKHTTWEQARRALGPEIENYLVIATVRDSLDQFVSSYFKIVHDAIDATAPRRRIRATRDARRTWAGSGVRTIDDYIDAFVRRPHAPVYALSLRRANVRLRFEHLRNDLDSLLDRLQLGGLPPVPRVNETTRDPRNLEALASADRVALVDRWHAPFRYEFGYRADPPPVRDRSHYEALIRLKSIELRRHDRALRKLAAKKPPL